MTGGGGEGGPRGIFLCLNFGGSIGSCCFGMILKIRSFFFDISPIWFAGVYRTYVGSSRFLPLTFLGFCAATAPDTSFSSAAFVLSVDSATSSCDGRSRLKSPASARCRSGIKSLKFVCMIRLSPCPCLAIASYFTFPSPSTCRVSALDETPFPLRPMSSGYCATGISGNAPPSPKSSGFRGRHPDRCPYGGGPLLFNTICDSSRTPRPTIRGPFG